ncbi:ParB N-terminal domain-containing protein [Rhodobacter sp. HX-7-19]|uniref:ParB N-terminal domain-containing protein n=1 Tax=Paragemmobacter kunshanensis TaxID=2583234 RepID=A0A6M1TVM4_9RHOB|nr:ParB N-terminal domain-containing protein [Rhodobacter kunshanensis]NGQ89274.1 ParB N-terminal domain-containing protein [Rhodobacter kunshanensis]
MLRHIDIQNCEQVTPADQPAPMLDWIPISKIVMDDEYQRELKPNNWAAIKRIAADFHWSRFSPVLLAPIEGGLYSCIDGQHRTHAAAICGFDRVPAMITTVTKAEQARAFVHVNGSQIRVSGHQVYRAALAAREPWAVSCRDAVEAADCRLMMNNSTLAKDKKPGEVFCIALIRKLVEAGKAGAVTAGLQALRAYEPEKVALYADYVLTPWLTAVASDPAFVNADLVAVLRKRNPYQVIEAAERYAGVERLPTAPTKRQFFERQILEHGFTVAA